MNELEALARLHLFPVRHHSPRSSAVLLAYLAQIKPRLVLVEGPDDASFLIDVLVDEKTKPPVAILGYRTDGTQGSSLWPFASYSPEYVALKWGVENGARVAFIDVPVGRALAGHVHEEEFDADAGELSLAGDAEPALADEETLSGEAPADRPLPVPEACARATGYRSFEEFWEASFEAPDYDPASFRAALLAYADLIRAADRQAIHRARDAYMARKILGYLGPDLAPEQVVVVLGAAHAAAFAAGDVDFALEQTLVDPLPSAVTLIPWSFPRLAEQTGYGAGNRAPQFYQRAHDAGCDFKRATLEVMVEFTEHLRLRGFMASLADTIEAYRLALTLADIRGKAEPGLDELREATTATLCRGDATHIDGFLWPSVVGRHIGRVADRIGKNSLQEEFWREVNARRLPASDEATEFPLKLSDPLQIETSVFLHRLRVAGVPYASFAGRQRLLGSTRRAQAEEAGSDDALFRTNEKWRAQWTPSTDIALIEKIIHGDTIQAVATRVLEESLSSARTTGDAASVLKEAVVTGTPGAMQAALSACDRLAATDEDLPSLAGACDTLSNLLSLGTSRAGSRVGDTLIPALCQRTFDRALLRLEDACTCSEEAAQKPKEALRTLHRVALNRPTIDREAWFYAARMLVESYAVNPGASGLCCGLLYLSQVISDEALALTVGQRLSNTLDPEGAAGFLQGFLEVNALALVKSRPVVAALDAFLTGIEGPRFRDALPVLRRAFAVLGPTERRYLLENLLAVRSIGEKAREAQAILLEKDKDKLKAMSADLAKAMDDLDDLL
ncbi:MAG: DUF5682 family protein [Minicystis sp.]